MNISEEEDCDDLPSISVNTSAYNSSKFAMPSAEELAEQRARDLECEHQLETLRQRARAVGRLELAPGDAGDSDGELALAAAVTSLSVRAVRAQPEHAAPAAELWAALAPHLPPHAAALRSCLSAPRLARSVSALAGALAAPGAWADDELQCAAALLSAAALARESRSRRGATRALHALFDERATPDQVGALVDVLLAALPAARARLLLSDVLRSGAGAGADLASAALAGAAALQLLRAPDAPDAPGAHWDALDVAASAWRACDEPSRYVCVQLAGRLLAAAAPGPAAPGPAAPGPAAPGPAAPGLAAPAQRERLLAHLAHLALPPAGAGDAHCADRLKTLVGVSKLKLLFSVKNGGSSQARPQPDVSK